MAHRVFRLSVSPEEQPEVRRVFEVDGRSTLHALHALIATSYALDPLKPPHAFFMSGRFWDEKTMLVDPRAQGNRTDRALLFRLGLSPGKTFAYLLGFESEAHFLVEVVEVRDEAQPLAAPVTLESVGSYVSATPQGALPEAPQPKELEELIELAEKFLDLHDDVGPDSDELEGSEPSSADDPELMLRAGRAALELAQALRGDVSRFQALDEWLISRSLLARLLDMPMELAHIDQTDLALQLADAITFLDPELVRGDSAIVLARAGRRDEALARVNENLEKAEDACLVERKAGDVYRQLGELDAAEAYYRRALALATTPSERSAPLLALADCLFQLGKLQEGQQLVAEERARHLALEALQTAGRNDPCPCGSGKKYKKCHGAGA